MRPKENNTKGRGQGQYDIEYKKCSCFWGKEASKFVRLIPKYKYPPGKVLDIGAGEGKNSFYLASLGYNITAIEISPYAIKNFVNRLIKEIEKSDKNLAEKMEIILGNALGWPLIKSEYDIVISYGFLHCLESKQMIAEVTKKIKAATKQGGLNVICTFTNDLPVPEIQKYLTPTLLTGKEVKKFYNDWEVVEYEVGTVEHSHPTSKTFHKHSVCRIITRKPK